MIVHLEFDVQVFQSLVHLLAGLIHLDHIFSIYTVWAIVSRLHSAALGRISLRIFPRQPCFSSGNTRRSTGPPAYFCRIPGESGWLTVIFPAMKGQQRRTDFVRYPVKCHFCRDGARHFEG